MTTIQTTAIVIIGNDTTCEEDRYPSKNIPRLSLRKNSIKKRPAG